MKPATPRRFDVPTGYRAPNSVQWRAYCVRCGEPMRVGDPKAEWWCCDCSPGMHNGGSPVYQFDETPWNDGWEANCLRAIEDAETDRC